MQQIQLEEDIRSYRTIAKSFDSNVIPHKGDFISDTAFIDPYEYEVIDVTFSDTEDECYVSLSPVVIQTGDINQLKSYIEMTSWHKWECKVPVE